MVSNAFAGCADPPTDEQLTSELGKAKPAWDQLLRDLADELELSIQEWHSYSRKVGWALRVKKRERNIVYLSPGRGAFMVSFALGDKAVQAARESKLPSSVMEIIDHAKRYAEGTAVRIDIRNLKEIAAVKKLTAIKLAH
jgi:hypothetical protein